MDGGSSQMPRQDAAGGWETERSPAGIGSIPEDALQVVFRHMDEATLKSARLAAKPFYEASKLYVKKLTGSSTAVRLTTLRGFPALSRLILEKDGMRGVQQEGGGVAWSKLAGLRWLRMLRLLEACDADLEELPHLSGQLQQLTLERCLRVGDAAMPKVACLTQLTSLTLYCEKLTNDGLKPLSALSALQTLKLFDSDQLDDGAFEHLLHVPCQELYIGNCHRVRGSGVPLLVGASGLTQLSFYGCNGLDDEGVQFFSELRSLPSLQQLSLGFCNQVTDDGVEVLAALTQLQHLNIGFCSNVTEMVVRFLAVALPQTHIALGRRDEGESADCMWVWTEFGNVQDPSGSDSIDAGVPAGPPMDLGVDDALDNLTLLAAPV